MIFDKVTLDFKLIAHRGNISGPSQFENNPNYIEETIKRGFDVEIDVWKNQGEFYLGHDEPKYRIDLEFLKNSKIWAHAKNFDAFSAMIFQGIHCFWHQEDDHVLTTKGYIWTYPLKPLSKQSIAVRLENSDFNHLKDECAGVCSDWLV